MSLFQSFEEAAGLSPQAGQAPAASGVLAAIIKMIQAQPGGVAGVIQRFEAAGLGGLVQSWLSDGPNGPIEADQVQRALGSGPVGEVASRLGLSPAEAASQIAQFLPLVLDHLSPNGAAPSGYGASQLQGLLAKLGSDISSRA